MNETKQKILIIGSGGREHAIGWKVAQSPQAGQIFFAEGNAGTLEIGTNVAISATDIPKLIEFVKREKIGLTLALPDNPLALGIVDEFQKEGLRIWGPSKASAQLEWSKAYSKDFMKRYGLPTAKFKIFKDYEEAYAYVRTQPMPVVIKASGLALGKGVIICSSTREAKEVLESMLIAKKFGESGTEVVIEEFLAGPEISIHIFSDGKNYKILPPSQDHKKIGEDNTGPNTGGMGTVAPLSFVDENLMKIIEEKIVAPTLEAMRKEGAPFTGLLYPGLILTEYGPKILEYNARFGDPETQIYMRLLDSDILDIFNAIVDEKLSEIEIKWKKLFACNIVLASAGYPNEYEKGKTIFGIKDAEMDSSIIVFHAGTKLDNSKNLVTNGGRVLGISAIGSTKEEALRKAYNAVKKITFEGMQYRSDIGQNS